MQRWSVTFSRTLALAYWSFFTLGVAPDDTAGASSSLDSVGAKLFPRDRRKHAMVGEPKWVVNGELPGNAWKQ